MEKSRNWHPISKSIAKISTIGNLTKVSSSVGRAEKPIERDIVCQKAIHAESENFGLSKGKSIIHIDIAELMAIRVIRNGSGLR